MKGKPIRYSAVELAWLEANRLLPIGEYAVGFAEAFGRAVDPRNLHGLRKRKGWRTGRTGQFAKGLVSHNAGKPMPSRGRSSETQFKPGQLSGTALLNRKPVGFERLSKDGYLERKIHDGLPYRSRWRAVHLIRWEELNGRVPAGHCLKNLTGDRLDTDPSNWRLISRALLPRLNGGTHKKLLAYDQASPDVKPTLLALAELAHATKRSRGPRV
ncbi:HNH endonuclease [Sphingomonas sp.]|uniref:HNH endonuclease n=1 Tax=Sphingomonas sp. TaxID=28214 RepID=UPI002EDB02A2